MHIPRSFAAAALLLIIGCSDTGLRVVPGPSADNPSPATGGPSPWDDLGELELPDQHFVVAWSTPEESRVTPSRIDLVDVLGSVVANYEHPGWTAENGTYFLEDFDWTALHPAAFQTVLVEQYRSFVEGDVGGDEDHTRIIWNLDLVSAEWRLDLLIESDETLFLPGPQQTIEPPLPTHQLHIVADPTDRDVVWLVYEGYLADGQPWALRRLDVTGAVAPVTWTDEELYAQGLAPEDRFRTIVTSAGATLDGEPVVTLGGWTTPLDLPEDEPHIWQVHAFGPQGQIDWNITIPVPDGAAVPRRMESVGGELEEFTALLQGQTGDYGCWAPGFTLVDEDQWWDVEVGDSSPCPRPGPLLDPSNHTFVWIGSGPGPEGSAGAPEEINVSHRGAEVWSIDTFRLGLSETAFRVHSLLRAD